MDDKRTAVKVDLDKDLDASVKRIQELMNGREPKDIPISDEYWKAIKKHRFAFNKKD